MPDYVSNKPEDARTEESDSLGITRHTEVTNHELRPDELRRYENRR